jgi:dTDP-glucose 4,6-dehydratase
MKVLITGGSGFLGHHLVKALLDNTNWDITIIDRASNRFGLKRLEELDVLNNKRVSLIRSDFATLDFASTMIGAGNFNFIFHLGAKTSVNESGINPDTYIHSNVVGTQKILEFACCQSQLISFIYVSTNEVFGPSVRGKAFAEWSPYNSQSIYAATKAAGEEIVLAYSIQFGVPVLVVHTMNIFGERESPERFIPQIVKSIIDNKAIPIYCDENLGMGGRTYLDVRAFSDALLFLSTGIMDDSLKFQREKINIAGEEFVTNDQLVMKISKIMGKPYNIELVNYYNKHSGHILNTSLDINILRSLGWRPQSSLDDGLERTVSWWLSNQNWPI